MTVRVIESTPQDNDGFAWYSFKENRTDLAKLLACVADQKGYVGKTLRVREIQIFSGDEKPVTRLSKVFTALFNWSNENNIKFYIDSDEVMFLFSLFAEHLKRHGLITSSSKHSNWIIFEGLNNIQVEEVDK